eukprot:238008-Rhodomonas_salina.1
MGPLGGDLEIRVLTRCPSLPRSRPLDPRADQDSDQARISRKMAAEVQLQEEGMAEMRRRRCDTETASHCLQRTFLASCSGLNGMLNGSAAMILPHKLCVLKASHVMSLSPGTMPACRFWRHCPLPSFALSLFHCLTVSLSLALLSLLLSMFHHSSPPPPIPRFSPSFFVISVSVLANSLLGDSRAWDGGSGLAVHAINNRHRAGSSEGDSLALAISLAFDRSFVNCFNGRRGLWAVGSKQMPEITCTVNL